MKTSKLVLVIAALVLSLPGKAAIIVSLEPASQSVSSGSPVSVDLVISGLGDHAAPSLGAFDFNLNYDPSILAGVSVSFGTHLDLGNLGSLRNSDLSTPGLIHLEEVSFESPGDLQANQAASFTLATLGFTGVGSGNGTVGFSSGSLSDETGRFSLGFTTTSAQVEVTGVAVPTPDASSTGCLLALGLLSLFSPRRRGQ